MFFVFFFLLTPGRVFETLFTLRVPLAGRGGKVPRDPATRTDLQKHAHSHDRPPFPHQAQRRPLPGTRGGGGGRTRAGGGEQSTKKAEATPDSALLFLITTRGPQLPPTHQPPTRPGDFPPSSLKQL